MRRPFASVLVPAVVLALAPAATAAASVQDDLSKPEIADQIAYARGLASSWQFLDLAENVLTDLEAADLTATQREELVLARCEVYASGARMVGDDARREPLFEQALDSYRQFVESYPGSDLLREAQLDYINVARDYGTHMSNLIEDAASDERERIGNELEERLTPVLSASSQAIASLEEIEDRTAAQERDLWNLKIARGRLLLQLGRATDDDGYLGLVETEMETVAFDAPVDSSFPLQAFIVLGEAYLAQGDVRGAADSFEYVAEQSIPQNRAEWDDLAPDLTDPQKNFRWSYLEFVTPPLIEARMQAGDTARAATAALHLLNMKNLESFDLSPRGELAQVAAARALFDAGGVVGGSPSSADYAWFQTAEEADTAGFNQRSIRPALELALSLALEVSETGTSLAEGRAKALINDLIESPGLSFGPEVLMEAAKGAYEARDYDAALAAFRRVLASVQGDPVEAQIYGGEVCWYMGECFRRQGRQLEAMMAYREGVAKWAGNDLYDGRNAQAAYTALGRALPDAGQQPVFLELQTELAGFVTQYVEEGTDVQWDLAERKYREAEQDPSETAAARAYREAASLYRDVPKSSKFYGAARSKIGLCLYKAGDLDAALNAFSDYETELTSTDDDAVRARLEAAFDRVRFYQGQIALDQENWQRALEIYSGFPSEFPDQVEFHDVALSAAVRSAVELEDVDRALALMERLQANFPDSRQTLNATGYLFQPLWSTYRASEPNSEERAEVIVPLSQVVEARNELAPNPSFDLLRIESKLWIELDRYEKALATLDKINTTFSGDPEYAERLENFVQPDLGVVYIQLDRLPEAHEILAPLVPDPEGEQPAPATDVVEAYVKSVAGWMEGDPSDPDVMAGVGGAEQLKKAFQWAVKLSNYPSLEKYSAEWFEARFLELWTLYQWSKAESRRAEDLRKILDSFKLDYDPDFGFITESTGADPSLAARYRWLDRLAR